MAENVSSLLWDIAPKTVSPCSFSPLTYPILTTSQMLSAVYARHLFMSEGTDFHFFFIVQRTL